MVNNNNNNNNWLLWVVLIVAVIAVILSAIAISKANVTGQGIFDIFRQRTSTQTKTTTPSATSNGLLADAYLSSGESAQDLKYYEAKYDENGQLIYEIIEDGTYYKIGSDYEEVQQNGQYFIKSKTTGIIMAPGPDPSDCKPRCPTTDTCNPSGLICNTPIKCTETGKQKHCRWNTQAGGGSSTD